ncbi:MAG TPA: GNAT family N-acetyltransferase [Rariglobus sp.]
MPTAGSFRIERLDPAKHRREAFRCESAPLTNFIQKRARKEMDARASACFVLVPESDPGRIAGYYTLTQTSIVLGKLPVELTKKLPRYPELGAPLIGRLARDLAWRGTGIGGMLLIEALRRCVRQSEEAGAIVVVTDPKDEKARAFYTAYGFQPLDDRRMFIPMNTVLAQLASAGAI